MAAVVAVARDSAHRFSKTAVDAIRLIAGEGVEGDAHRGVTVRHRSRVAVDPTQPNLRRTHLIHAELLDELAGQGFALQPGDLGENVLTRGVDLLALSAGTRLTLGCSAIVMVTGLRNPCAQIEAFRPGLLSRVLDKTPDGRVIRKTGVMAVVLAGGVVAPGDPIVATPPDGPFRPLDRV